MVVGIANTIVVVIMAAILIMIIGDVGLIRSVSTAPTCGSENASGAYSSQVTKLVSALQQKAQKKKNFKATLKQGPVKGTASCTPSKKDRKAAKSDCLACLAGAEVDLVHGGCKGKKSGSSTGASDLGLDGKCRMSFGPA
ncbi:hypothetical protein LINGRAHAP2_LOCUS3335 [Linum grandiflorum]